MKSKTGLSAVEATILLAILLLLAAISIPAWTQNRQRKQAAQCTRMLEAISKASEQYAADQGTFPGSLSDLAPRYLEAVPVCPAGGTYTLGTSEGDPPTCSHTGHSL